MRHDTPAYIHQWTGYVILPDALNYPQLLTWEDARQELETLKVETWGEGAANPHGTNHIVPALCALVREWHLSGLPERLTIDTFPATPRTQSTLLIVWLVGLIASLYAGSEETPEKKDE